MIPTTVSDSGPLISFEKIPKGFGLFRRVASRVLIPPQVLEEVTAGLPLGHDYLTHYDLRGFVEVIPAPPPPEAADALHDGERYAISLALSQGVPLLAEDRDARLIAEHLGIRTIGALGVLLAGHNAGTISTVELRDAAMALRRAGRISQALLDEALRSRNH